MIVISLDPEPYNPAHYTDNPDIIAREREGFRTGELSVYVVESYSDDADDDSDPIDAICCVIAESGLVGMYRTGYDIPNEFVKDIALDLEV
jgi:hypothetical protein